MYESHYGKGMKKSDEEYIIPGSPDARKKAYTKDMYDDMQGLSGYGKKVSTKKNRTGTGEPNTGIQGSATRSKSGNTQDRSEKAKGTGRTHRSSYSSANLDNSPTPSDEYDYGKGRMKKGDQRKRIKEQGK